LVTLATRTYLTHLIELEAQAKATKPENDGEPTRAVARKEKCRTCRSDYPNSPHARNLKLPDQKSGPAMGKNLAVPTEPFISFDSMPLEGPDQLWLKAIA